MADDAADRLLTQLLRAATVRESVVGYCGKPVRFPLRRVSEWNDAKDRWLTRAARLVAERSHA